MDLASSVALYLVSHHHLQHQVLLIAAKMVLMCKETAGLGTAQLSPKLNRSL